MATKKVFLTGKVELKTTFSQLSEPVDKKKVRSRGPNQIGQLKTTSVVLMGKVPKEEVVRRLAIAKKVLETGNVPTKDVTPKTKRTDTTEKKPTPAPKKAAAKKEATEKAEEPVEKKK